MQIRILGTGSGLPELGKHLSSVHVNCRGKQYLLDCGEGSIYQLLRYGVDVNDLDAVVITHFHPDHVAGIFMLVQMLYLQGRSKDLSIFIPERTEEFEGLFSMFYTFPERLCFRLTILPMAELNSKFPDLQAWPNDHLLGYSDVIQKHKYPNQMKAFSIQVHDDKYDFAYSSDIGSTDSIAPMFEGVHTLLVDAGHPAPEQIYKLQNSKLKRILLTHGVSPVLLRELVKQENALFEEAIEGIIYNL